MKKVLKKKPGLMVPLRNSLVFLLLIFFAPGSVFSQQEIYRTIKGDITLTILYKDSGVVAASNQLIAFLDYDTGKLIFRAQYATFHTGNDSINRELKLAAPQELKFEGQLDIFVNPKKKTPQKYNLTGMMTSGASPFFTEGNGTVLCIPAINNDDVPSCKLIATIKCKLSELNLTDIFKNADSNVQVDIRQSLLEKEK
jgi:hypothetical protein